jgi:hypothetical protein
MTTFDSSWLHRADLEDKIKLMDSNLDLLKLAFFQGLTDRYCFLLRPILCQGFIEESLFMKEIYTDG